MRWIVSDWRHAIEDRATGRVLFKSSSATDIEEALAAAAPELREALEEVLSWHDFSDDLTKPIEVRAAYMRARSLLTALKLLED